MKAFTYYDYLEYKRLKREESLKCICILQEEGEKYIYKNKEEVKKIKQPHDKIFKLVLDNKEEVAKLINRELKLKKKIRKEDIEKYNSSFISKRFKNLESDIVYKKKDKNIFFLIEHQSKIDYSMHKRILDYEIEIMEMALEHKNLNKKEEKLPTIIPIIIYTGEKKWNVKTSIEEIQEKLEGAEKVGLGNYYIVDINNYREEELIEDKLFLSKIMLLEKMKTSEKLFEALEKIMRKEKEENNKKLLKRMIYYIYSEKLGKSKTEELLRKIEKGGERDMILEMIRKENQELVNRGKREGIQEGIRKITKGMLNMGMEEKTIIQVTGITEEELKIIKEEMNKR